MNLTEILKTINQKRLASIMGVTQVTMSRWSTSKQKPSLQAQRHLEMIYHFKKLTGHYPVYKERLGRKTSKCLVQGELFN